MADSEKIMGQTAAAVLWQALTFTEDADVHLLTDSGVENVNRVVDDFLAPLPIRRVLAQVEIAESNSMVEAFWKSLRHQWLYLHRLESIEAVRQLVDFYVTQYNAMVPHYAHDGQIPDEVYASRLPIASIIAEPRARPRVIGSSTTARGPAPCAVMSRLCLKPKARKCNTIPTLCPEPLLGVRTFNTPKAMDLV